MNIAWIKTIKQLIDQSGLLWRENYKNCTNQDDKTSGRVVLDLGGGNFCPHLMWGEKVLVKE